MKKTFRSIIALALVLCLAVPFMTMGAFAQELEGKYDKSKEATELYDEKYTDVTLSVPGEVETLSSDIVFVVDKSSSDSLSADFANSFFEQLIALQKNSGASIKVGVVIYNYDGHIALPLTELTADNYTGLLNSLPTYKGGTNADAGLILAKQMLDEDTEVEASRKHVILIGDGLNWAFDVNGKPHTILLKKDENSNGTLYGAGTETWLSSGRKGTSGYSIPEPFNSWEEYWEQIVAWVEADGDKYVFDITNLRGDDTSIPTPDYSSKAAVDSAVPKTEVYSHALNMDRALYDTWESYTALQNAGYNCNAYYTDDSTSNIGYHLMKMLAGSGSLSFEDIKHEILYSVSKGSKVVDYIGYKEGEYNFDFIDNAENITLKVGNIEYLTAKEENLNPEATSLYSFTAPGNEEPTFFLEYFKGNGKDTEHFVWTMNEDVSKFAPVSLTYTLELTEKITVPGEYTAETNIIATLYPKDSNGEDGTPELFPVPVINYTVPEILEDIEDPDVPLAPGKDNEDDVKGDYVEKEEPEENEEYEEIEDEEVPKAEPNPATSDISFAVVMASQVAAFTLGGAALFGKNKLNK